jgi:hypothetical protein
MISLRPSLARVPQLRNWLAIVLIQRVEERTQRNNIVGIDVHPTFRITVNPLD